MVLAGVLIRRRLEETPAFQAEASEDAVAKIPLAVLLRDHCADVLRVALAAMASTVSTIFAVYALNFAVDTKGLDRTTMLWVAIVTNVVALAALPAWAILVGPRRAQAGVHLRRGRQRRADVRLPRRDRERSLAADLHRRRSPCPASSTAP